MNERIGCIRVSDYRLLCRIDNCLRQVATYREPSQRPPDLPRDIPLPRQLREHPETEAEKTHHTHEESVSPPPNPIPFSQVFRQQHQFILLGEPGAGKTTALRFVATTLAAQAPTAPPHWPRHLRACTLQALPEALDAFLNDMLKALAPSAVMTALMAWLTGTPMAAAAGGSLAIVGLWAGSFLIFLIFSLIAQWGLRALRCFIKSMK